ncbi:hypothetical protein BC332_14164 [Capsicum chinense]|nr:hypothetical protein BC332_14164 [Capsicum chinense]
MKIIFIVAVKRISTVGSDIIAYLSCLCHLYWLQCESHLPVGSENNWTTSIHIAVGAGKVDILHELLNHCPDCWEILDNNGRNSLHEAILYCQANVVSYLLKPTKWDMLIEDLENDGNTSLHFLASSNFGAMCLWN